MFNACGGAELQWFDFATRCNFVAAGGTYKSPDIEFKGGTLETEMNLNFDIKNIGPGSSSQVIQTVETKIPVPSATYKLDDKVGFVDGGVNSTVTLGNTSTNSMYSPGRVNPGEPYYIFSTIVNTPQGQKLKGTGEIVDDGGGNSSLRVYDNPNAQNNMMTTVNFQTIIVATNFYNSGVDVVLGTFNWGFNNSMTGAYTQTHQSNTVIFTIPTERTMEIIFNDYPGYQILR